MYFYWKTVAGILALACSVAMPLISAVKHHANTGCGEQAKEARHLDSRCVR